MFELDNVKNEAILRDVFIFESWQRPKRSNSARLLQFLNLTTSKTKQICGTSAVFELDTIQNEGILRDFVNFWTWQHQKQSNSARFSESFKYRKLSAALTASYQCGFAIFPLHLSTVLRLPRKIDARSYEVLHLSRKIILANLQIGCSKMQPLSKSAPWPPNISHEHVFCTAPATRNASCQILCICPTPAIVFETATKPSRFARSWQGAQSLAPATQNDIWTSKSSPRHNGGHLFDISISKSGPSMVCFVRFDLEMCFAPALFRHLNFRVVCFVNFDFEMCFAPQRRALFRHLNFQKWSDVGVLCTFWLRMRFAPQQRETFHLSSDHMAPHPPL